MKLDRTLPPKTCCAGSSWRSLLRAFAACVVLLLGCGRGFVTDLRFAIHTETPAAHRVSYEDLQAAGLPPKAKVSSKGLSLTHGGAEVPIWVVDGRDGVFGPGDHFEFLAERVLGERSFHNEFTNLNVYRLALDGRDGEDGEGLRMTMASAPPADRRAEASIPQHAEMHLEENFLLIHFVGKRLVEEEPRFWARLTQVDPEPFRQTLALSRFEPSDVPFSIRVELHGWSFQREDKRVLPDHRVEVWLNGQQVGHGEWDGQTRYRLEVPHVDPALVVPGGENVLEVKVPERQAPDGRTIIDAVLLDWIELRYPVATRIGPEPGRILLSKSPQEGAERIAPLQLDLHRGARWVAYGKSGHRYDYQTNFEFEDRDEGTVGRLFPAAGEEELYATPTELLRAPVLVELDHPSDLRNVENQADYLIVSHPDFLGAIDPLVEMHRASGLTVEVADIRDVYDDFNHGILDPRAIRDFVSYAYHEWSPPKPRFVLLVGDASWEARGAGPALIADPDDPTGQTMKEALRRNFVPTWSYPSSQGRAATDNFFVAVDGDDPLPDLAIGRLPVALVEEAEAVVDKLVRYGSELPVGPWRRNLLWLSSESNLMQDKSELVREATADQGFASTRLYARTEIKSEEHSQDPLRAAFNRGQLVVHFLGHGARFVWQTGSVGDQDNTYNLFTLEHLHELEAASHWPLVLSMTCWSAPFDNPERDSLGERFVLLPDRGAIGFFGASWKVPAFARFSMLLFEGLMEHETVGEAIVAAKHDVNFEHLVHVYNYFGDPATRLALPKLPVDLSLGEEQELVVNVADGSFSGRAIVDWTDANDQIVHSEELEVTSLPLRVAQQSFSAATAVRVYVWNEEQELDGMAALALDGMPEDDAPEASANVAAGP